MELEHACRAICGDEPHQLASLVFDLVDRGDLLTLSYDPEAQVLMESAKTFPDRVWDELASRIAGEERF